MFRNFIPPVLYNAYIENRRKYGYFGEYQSWQEAKSKSDGYDSDIIIEKVKDAALKVRRGEAAFERDSVLFSKVEVAWHVLAYLLWIASLNKNVLNILDFGGSLGTTFYQNRNFLDHVELNWAIIEQSKFVEYGKKILPR
jgi:putative methyltransferase (TIGR04325 family)